MERTRTVKRGYVVFGESITLRWGVELSWGNRALGTGKAGCGVRLAAVAAGFAGRAVVFFYSAGKSGACDLDARQDLLKLETGFTFLS